MPSRTTPKTRFRQDKESSLKHIDFVDSSAVQRSIDVALTQLMDEYNQDRSPTCTLNALRLQGAQDFVRVWCNLGDEPTKLERKTEGTLIDNPDTWKKKN